MSRLMIDGQGKRPEVARLDRGLRALERSAPWSFVEAASADLRAVGWGFTENATPPAHTVDVAA